MKRFIILVGLMALLQFSCRQKTQVDLIVHHGVVYTVDSTFSIAEAFAVKDGKFVAVGSNKDILSKYSAVKMIDAGGKAVYPGFIDAHCHFYSYGKTRTEADLIGCRSFKEMVNRVVAYSKTNKAPWIVGRGWDQNLWAVREFPLKDTLDMLFPNTPIYLSRVDGHAALVNQKALDLAGINFDTKVAGGEIIKISKSTGYDDFRIINGQMKNFGHPSKTEVTRITGVLVDNATDLVKKVIPEPSKEEIMQYLLKAQEDCYKVGLTTVDDAGLDKKIIDIIDEMQKSGKLKMRIYAMASGTPENMDYYLKHGPYKTDQLNVRSFKFYADGALGSRGACLLQPYDDKPDQQGFLLQKPEYYVEMAKRIANSPFQMNTHCIGDSANRYILDVYASVLGENNNRRWRIEHAQIVNKNDFAKFGRYQILPSVQPTHATSDMYWAKDRIGEARLKGGYALKQLMEQNGVLPTGSDFPVESINPLYGFYAAVARQDSAGFPVGGFQPENALSRQEALKGMTIWAAYANFEEKEKGSIEPGKFADFVILEKDIMNIPLKELRATRVVTNRMGL
jgi:predicted amidohydrolase YtcJ